VLYDTSDYYLRVVPAASGRDVCASAG